MASPENETPEIQTLVFPSSVQAQTSADTIESYQPTQLALAIIIYSIHPSKQPILWVNIRP